MQQSILQASQNWIIYDSFYSMQCIACQY